MNGQQFVSCFFQARECLGILSFQKNPQFFHNLFGGVQTLRLAQPREETIHLTVMAVRKVAFNVTSFMNQTALDDGVWPFLSNRFAQRLCSVCYSKQSASRAKTACFDPVEKVGADLKVLGSTDLKVEDVFFTLNRDAQCHDGTQIVSGRNTIKHKHNIIGFAQIPASQLLNTTLAFLLP